MQALNRIGEVRAKLGLTQAEFASAIGLTQGAVSHYERHLTDVRPDVARRIVSYSRARGVQVTFNDIYIEPDPLDQSSGLDRTIQAMGSVERLAERLGVPLGSAQAWQESGVVPAEHCPAIEQLTHGAVRCEELRPDIPWGVLRQSQAEQGGGQ